MPTKRTSTYISLALLSLSMSGCSAWKPKELGLQNGQLRPCPPAPKCVSTYYEKGVHHISPLPYLESREKSYAKVVDIINRIEKSKIVKKESHYIHAQFEVTSIKWIDDVEFLFDDANRTIHFSSSASAKIGFWDWGENKRRAKLIIKLYNENQ